MWRILVLLLAATAIASTRRATYSICDSINAASAVAIGVVGPSNFELARMLGIESALSTFQFQIEQNIRGFNASVKSVSLPFPKSTHEWDFKLGKRMLVAGDFDSKGNFIAKALLADGDAELTLSEAQTLAMGGALIYGFITNGLPYQPAPGVQIRLKSSSQDIVLATNEKGSFRSTAVAPGHYSVSISHSGKEPLYFPHNRYAELHLPAHGCVNFGASLFEGASIEGRVVDANGKPMPDVLIAARPDSNAVRTNSEGLFRIPGLQPGKYFLFAHSPDFRKPPTFRSSYLSTPIDLTSYQHKSNITFRLPPFGPKVPLTLRVDPSENPNVRRTSIIFTPTQNLHNQTGIPQPESCYLDKNLECHIELFEHVEYKISGSGFRFTAKRNARYSIP